MTDNAIDPGSSSAARAALASLIDLHGPALLHEPDRLKRQLDGALPDAPRAAELILSSMSEEVPHALLAAHSDEQLRTLFPQLVDRLVRKTGVEHSAATWAVRTWAHALAVAVEGRDADRPDGMRRAVDRLASDVAPRSLDDVRPHGSAIDRTILEDREASRRSSTAEVLGFGTRPVRLKAPSTVRPTGPLVSPPPAAETLVAFDASRERAADGAPDNDADAQLELPVFVGQPAEPVEPVIAALEAPAVVPAPAFVPAPVAPSEAVDPPPLHAASHEPVAVTEPAAPVEAPSPIAVEKSPAVAPDIVVPVAVPVMRVDTAPGLAPLESADEATALPFAPQRRSSSRTFALAAAIAAAVIVVGATLWPTPQPRSAPDTTPTANLTPPARVTPVPATVAAATVAPAAVAPAPVAPPPVDKPSEPVVATSQPAAAINATSGAQRPAEAPSPRLENVASPTREAALPVGAEVTATPVIPPRPPAPKPAPRAVVKPEAPITRPVVVATAAQKTAKAPEPRKPATAPAACTRSTCGSVVSVRPIDDALTRDYEVIVRLDDRTIRAVRMPARWSTGARVRVVGGRFEPAGDR